MKVERLQPGRKDQIVLRRDPAKYPNFEVRNVAANGEVWTGVGVNTRTHHPRIADLKPAEYPTENVCSLVIRLRYGKFDFYSGGDIPGAHRDGAPLWNDMETPVAQVIGPVEVSVLNHHGNRDSQNGFFVASLRPQVFLIPVWSVDHPSPKRERPDSLTRPADGRHCSPGVPVRSVVQYPLKGRRAYGLPFAFLFMLSTIIFATLSTAAST